VNRMTTEAILVDAITDAAGATAVRYGLHFDQARQGGVVFHMMNALAELGLVGLTAVGNTHVEADALYARTVAALESEAASAI